MKTYIDILTLIRDKLFNTLCIFTVLCMHIKHIDLFSILLAIIISKGKVVITSTEFLEP